MTPELLEKAKAKGSDAEFQAYVRKFPCVFTRLYDRVENGVPKSIYAHVNRVDRGSGIAHKTPYSGVPTLDEIHTVLMHGKGENKNLRKFLDQQSVIVLRNFVNGVNPPEYEVYKKQTKQIYEIDCPEILDAITMGIKRVWQGNDNKLLRITVERARKKRTNQQNKAQWVLYQQIAEKCQARPSLLGNIAFEFANTLVQRAIRHDTESAIHEMLKVICNEGKSTTSLKTDTWGEEYAHEIIHFVREKLNEDLMMPVNDHGLTGFEGRFNH